jgi:hypothetical protein
MADDAIASWAAATVRVYQVDGNDVDAYAAAAQGSARTRTAIPGLVTYRRRRTSPTIRAYVDPAELAR